MTRKTFLKGSNGKYIFIYLLLTGEVMTPAIRKIMPFLKEAPQKNGYVEETELSSLIFKLKF